MNNKLHPVLSSPIHLENEAYMLLTTTYVQGSYETVFVAVIDDPEELMNYRNNPEASYYRAYWPMNHIIFKSSEETVLGGLIRAHEEMLERYSKVHEKEAALMALIH